MDVQVLHSRMFCMQILQKVCVRLHIKPNFPELFQIHLEKSQLRFPRLSQSSPFTFMDSNFHLDFVLTIPCCLVSSSAHVSRGRSPFILGVGIRK